MKRLLFLDIVAPEPDRNASSVRSAQLLSMLVTRGYAVDFAPWRPPERADQVQLIKRLGVTPLPWLDEGARTDFIAAHARDYATIYFAWSNVARRFIAPARRAAPTAGLIYDTHDVNHVRTYREARVTANQRTLMRAMQVKAHEAQCMAIADLTLAITEADAALLQAVAPTARIAVVPMWAEPVDARRAPEPATLLFLGNFSSPHNHDAALFMAKDVMPRIRRDVPDARFIAAGNDPREEIVALARGGVEVTGWVPDLAPLFARAAVFVAPLRFGSGLKGKMLQAMAHGVPVVASTIAAEGIGLVDGEHFLCADTPEVLAAACVALLRDPARAQSLAENARNLLVRDFAHAAIERRFDTALTMLETR